MKIAAALLLCISANLLSCQPKEKFEKTKWRQREGPASPSGSRVRMLDDLLARYPLDGIPYSQLKDLLGEPDFGADRSVGYEIIVDYGWDIDHVYTKWLEFELTNGKAIKAVRVREWKK